MLKSSPKWWFLMGAYSGFLVAGFNPLEKYESQWEGVSHVSHIFWNIKHVPNHQPDMVSILLDS
jgi:hypothetical protein